MFYVFFSCFHISLAFVSEFTHNSRILLGTNNVIQYAQSQDEIKVLEYSPSEIYKYDQLKEKFISYSLGVELIDESIVQVISKFTPFDDEQRVDILTNCSNVYTIRYHKYFQGTNSTQKYTLLEGENCNSITYVADQFVVLCNKPVQQIFIQNGTKITTPNSLIKINKIQSFYEGLVMLCDNLIIIYDELLNFENHIYLDYLQLITNEEGAHILTNEYYFSFFNSQISLEYFHQCQNTTQFMEMIGINLYIQCKNTLILVNQATYFHQIQAQTFSSTFEYIIIDNTKVYDKTLNYQYYISQTPLYPIKFDNQVLTIKDNVLFVGKIIGLFVIQVNESFFSQDATIFFVEPGLQNLHIEEQEVVRDEIIFYFRNYLTGPDIQISSGATVPETKIITMNKDIVNIFKGQQNFFGFIYKLENMISMSFFCSLKTIQVNKDCQSLGDSLQIKNNFTKSNSFFIQSSDQFVTFILDGQTLRSFSLSNTYGDIDDVLAFYTGDSMLVVLKQSSTLLYVIQKDQYQMIAQLQLKSFGVALSQTQITLLIENNKLITLKFSIDGLFKSYEEQFTEKILNINYVQNQLLVTLKDKILVYEKQILRGKVDLDIIGNIQFVQTERNLYVYNQTTVYVFQIYKEISLSSYLQQVIVVEEEINNLQAISFNDYELLLINQDLYILEALKTFKLITIVDDDQFANIINCKINFTNRYKQTAQLQFKAYGETLKLKALFCQETFEINKIEVNKIFDGPIQNIEGNNGIQIIQRVEQITTKQFWFNQKISHILPLSDKGQIIVIMNDSDINICDKSHCLLLVKSEFLCRHLEEDQLYYYAVCGTLIYRGQKQHPLKVEQLPFYFNETEQYQVKFNGNLILGYTFDIEIQWKIYQDFEFKVQICNLVEFKIFEIDKIIAINSTSIIIYDLNFVIILQFQFYPLLKQYQIDFQEQYLYLVDIIKIEDNSYIVTTSDLLIFEIFIQGNFVEIVRIYNSLQHIINGKLLQINSNVFALFGINLIKLEYHIAFYDRRYFNENKKIIPYFQVLSLTSKIFINQIDVRKIAESKIIVLIRDDIYEYIIHDYIQIVNSTEIANSTQTIQLIAYDGKLQKQTSTVNIKFPSIDTVRQIYNIKIIYCILLAFVVILLIASLGSKYFISKKKKQKNQFILEKHQQV